MAFFNFLKPKNKLEEGGRTSAPALPNADRNCPNCHKDFPVEKLRENKMVCNCGYHFRIGARERITMLVDEGSFTETNGDLKSINPLSFPFYEDKLKTAITNSKENDAVITGTAKINGEECCLFVMDSNFMMGSMGSVVGEKITSIFEYAIEKRLPVVGFTVSGGARMQEGLLSLMQMAKTSAAVKRHSQEGLLYVVVLTDPTTGGVTASFAMEADIILSEPNALVGFAGQRVIQQTTKEVLPKGFQKAEFVLEHGFIDSIIERGKQREVLSEILNMHNGGRD